MTEKEEKIINEIMKYYNENHGLPTIRYLQQKLGYKSPNSVFRYLKKLEISGYIKRNNENKIVIDLNLINYNNDFKRIEIINRKNHYINIVLNQRKEYVAYQVNNSDLKKYGIIKDDILIIQKNCSPNNNEIGLFIIDNKKRIMRYQYKDGFYILNDKEELILNKINLIGKVILLERKIKL